MKKATPKWGRDEVIDVLVTEALNECRPPEERRKCAVAGYVESGASKMFDSEGLSLLTWIWVIPIWWGFRFVAASAR